jgi:hypothetical protein
MIETTHYTIDTHLSIVGHVSPELRMLYFLLVQALFLNVCDKIFYISCFSDDSHSNTF